MVKRVAVALTIAGSDSSGGAGIQADLKTFAAHKVYGTCAITAVTAQNTRRVIEILPLPASHIVAQMSAVFEDFDIAAVKIGMIANADAVKAIADELVRQKSIRGAPLPIVLDPVMGASTGSKFQDDKTPEILKHQLMPLADLITPNLAEAARLLGINQAVTTDEKIWQAEELVRQGAKAVLVKGGHTPSTPGSQNKAVDIYFDGREILSFEAPRIENIEIHGTGCTLASAIAANLAKGRPLPQSVKRAKHFVTQAISHANQLNIGNGASPLHQFFQN